MKKFLIKIAMKLFKFKFVTVGIPVIIKNNKGEILLGKRSKNVATYKNMWGLPGGLMDYKENLEEAAKRELKEELGVEIKIIKRSNEVYNVLPTKENKFHSVNIVFYAKIISGNPTPKDETREVKWFKPSEIKKMNLAYTHKEILEKEGLI
jgi:8-oxo-dGTP diphosphatase